jgi:hypothetical protein
MDRRSRLIEKLTRLAETMLQGSLSQTTRTCGKPSCRCHGGERHGPHTYLTFRNDKGHSSGVYVPATELKRFRQGVADWKRFWELATELSQLNREQLVRERQARRRRSDARKA